MAKKKTYRRVKSGKTSKANNSQAINPEYIENAFESTVGVGGGVYPGALAQLGIGHPGSGYPSEQLSQPTTGMINLRNYLVSNMRQFLSELYVEIGLVQTIVNVPVDDALRGGVEIKSKRLDDDQIQTLKGSLDRNNEIATVGQSAKWSRLYGGGGILILTSQDPRTPLNLNRLKDDPDLQFRAVDMWELFWDKQGDEDYDPALQEHESEYFNYYGEQVHKSRVMRIKGLIAPSFVRPRLRGWGFSVAESLIRSINQYLKATDLTFEVLDEFKVDIFKIKNLVNTLMQPNGKQKVVERVQLANYTKNYQNSIVMDAEDDMITKQLSFAGLSDTMGQIRMQVASDMRMPQTKLFGISSAGFNSGEDDIEVYNSMVESEVRNKIKYIILRMIEIKCQHLFGFIPDDLELEFKPLREMSAPEQEEVKTKKFTRLLQMFQAGAMSLEEFRDNCNRGNLTDVAFDDIPPELTGYNADNIEEGTDQPRIGIERGDPAAANLPESRPAVGQATPAPRLAIARNSMDISWVKPYSFLELATRMFNSIAYDKAAYEADGGDSWIDPRRKALFENPGNVDEGLWSKAKEASRQAFGEVRWQFVVYMYKKWGGHF